MCKMWYNVKLNSEFVWNSGAKNSLTSSIFQDTSSTKSDLLPFMQTFKCIKIGLNAEFSFS